MASVWFWEMFTIHITLQIQTENDILRGMAEELRIGW